MTNTNCLEGVRCPVCANEDTFFIEIRALATLTDAGVEESDDHEWDDTGYTQCPECREEGTLAHFRTPEVDAPRALRNVLRLVVRGYPHLLDEKMLTHEAEMLRRLFEVVEANTAVAKANGGAQ
jgi:Zn ribbon nucleic-acid-binding protein